MQCIIEERNSVIHCDVL